jgi:hypothetical protein
VDPAVSLATLFQVPNLKALTNSIVHCTFAVNVKEFAQLSTRLIDCEGVVQQQANSGKRGLFASAAAVAARAVLAMMLLLTLVAGSIVLPAAAGGPLCTLACCAGRAAHAAGSCMDGSCDPGVATPKPANNSAPQLHHHHEQQLAEATNSNAPTPAFAGAMASAGGSDMDQVPTIEATSDGALADNGTRAETSNTNRPSANRAGISAKVFSKPCQPDCGVCASGFAAPKRSRYAAGLAGPLNVTPPSSVQLNVGGKPLMRKRSALGRQSVPRGPPVSFSC